MLLSFYILIVHDLKKTVQLIITYPLDALKEFEDYLDKKEKNKTD